MPSTFGSIRNWSIFSARELSAQKNSIAAHRATESLRVRPCIFPVKTPAATMGNMSGVIIFPDSRHSAGLRKEARYNVC